VGGQYVTVSSGEEFRRMAETLANPPTFEGESVVVSKLRMGLCRKENLQGERLCLCHFDKVRTYYTCNICEATICRDPPVECPVCETILILPTDLYNHIIIDRAQK
jgi:rubrerythrin